MRAGLTDSANSDKKANTVTLSAANRLKLANMMMSQNARMAMKGAGMALLDSTNSNRRVWAKSVLTCAARACSDRCKSFFGDNACIAT